MGEAILTLIFSASGQKKSLLIWLLPSLSPFIPNVSINYKGMQLVYVHVCCFNEAVKILMSKFSCRRTH